MANQIYRVFPNKVELFKFFNMYAPELNVGISSRLPMNGFCVGSEHKAFRSYPNFLQALAALSGLDVDTRVSTFRLGTYIIFFNSAIPNPNRRGKTVEAVVAKQEVTEVKEEVKQEIATPETIDKAAVIAKAEALYDESDKRGSKDKLDVFATEYGVSLSKTKTFDNMMVDFKAAIESK